MPGEMKTDFNRLFLNTASGIYYLEGYPQFQDVAESVISRCEPITLSLKTSMHSNDRQLKT